MKHPPTDWSQPYRPGFLSRIFSRAQEELEDYDKLQVALEPVREHIHAMWQKLVRSHNDLYRDALYDPKVPRDDAAPRLLYISAKEDEDRVLHELAFARERLTQRIAEGLEPSLSEADFPDIIVRRLPPLGEPLNLPDHQHSLMYLPYPYVVPGPRFNEMYNWDTAFVIRGLLQDEKFDLAKSQVENMLYQIEHYGTILNGNRTYYYDSGKSRSQPPLHTAKILGVYNNYDKLRTEQTETKVAWLKRAAATSEKYYRHWVTRPHLHEPSGLSMFHSDLAFPAYEVTHGEHEHYAKALSILHEMHQRQQTLGDDIAVLDYQDRKDRYYLEQYYLPAAGTESHSLSPRFFQGDRAMRETGFDPSRRFGFFNVDVINYLPVCLNALRQKIERQMGLIYRELAQHEPEGKNIQGISWFEMAEKWEKRAGQTAELINQWLWDEGEQDAQGNWLRHPCYRDRNINTALCEKYRIRPFRDYDFVTSFYPMWVGVASRYQAEMLVTHLLPRLQCVWGVYTSSRETGSQWDKPFIWAPLVMITVESLERYDYYRQALEIAAGFLHMIIADFGRTGKLYEKYDGSLGSSDVSARIAMGYSENVEGFAWTNSVVLELSHAIDRLQYKLRGEAVPTPDILTQMTVIESGVARPQYESGE